MAEEKQLVVAENNEHEAFRRSIEDLDRNLKSSRRGSICAILALLAAIGVSLFFGFSAPDRPIDIIAAFDAFLVAMLAFEGITLARQKKAHDIRNQLAQQMDLSLKQRLRAEKLYGLSIMDPLTGLHNRRFGEERLRDEITRADRNGDQLAVIFFDLDYFKEINDQYGHAAGDMALKEFSRKLKRAIRACDVPVRIGGDEFFVILPECPREKVDLILSRIGSPTFKFGGEIITIRYSVGRSHYQVADTLETMLARADEALYAAKADRPNNGQSRTPEDEAAHKSAAPISLLDQLEGAYSIEQNPNGEAEVLQQSRSGPLEKPDF